MEEQYIKAKEILIKYKQEQLLLLYNKLDKLKKQELLNEILNIDFKQINELYENTKKPAEISTDIIEPIPFIDKEKLNLNERKFYEEKGIKEIKDGKIAVVTMAGRTRYKTSGMLGQKEHIC